MATRVVAIGFSAAADGRALFIDRDTELVGIGTLSKATSVSEDPSATIANTQTAPANSQIPGLIFAGLLPIFGFAFPLQEGRSIFVSSSAAQTVTLFFQDPP